jgi:hypothetical protein
MDWTDGYSGHFDSPAIIDINYNNSYLGVPTPMLRLGRASVEAAGNVTCVPNGTYVDNPLAASQGLRVTSAEVCVITLCQSTVDIDVRNHETNVTFPHTDAGSIRQFLTQNSSQVGCWTPSNVSSFELDKLKTKILGTQDPCDAYLTGGRSFCAPVLSETCQGLFSPLSYAEALRDWLSENDMLNPFAESWRRGSNYSNKATKLAAEQGLGPILDGVAAALTAKALEDTNTRELINGTSWQTQYVVHVTWSWLTLPFAVELAALSG